MERLSTETGFSTFLSSIPRSRHKSSKIRLPNVRALAEVSGVSEEIQFKVLFAAGGTGGHVYPALAIAEAIRAADRSACVEFVGTKHRIEATAVPHAGYTFHHIPAPPLARPIFRSPQNLLIPWRLLVSVFASVRLILTFRPQVVIGTGGYVSGPVCLAALLCGCPYVIQEQNVRPGLANKILATFATLVFIAFADTITHFPFRKCIVSGNPVRATVKKVVPQEVALKHFFPRWSSTHLSDGCTQCDKRWEVVLIQGGSLGAKSLNLAVIGFVERMLDEHPKRLILWQTGSKHHEGIVNKVKRRDRVYISEFLHDINMAYSAADLIVACAGAITCSELLILGKPSVLIPLEYVADNHQRDNALVLQKAGAARILDDVGLNSEKLEVAINQLLGDKAMLANMSKNATSISVTNAAELISKEVSLLAQGQMMKKGNHFVKISKELLTCLRIKPS
ncbi:hypothetical protein KP509_06G066800 [Ceratopteris richardii]|uniref:Undecaprenyldiphospho-muramoylpentapeptide beta-N-acetylglucosaminyltransferase n=1 Tax=Ceratopteris richardii TaxID=49495 RepID=A0A8T2UQ30_CERRI|nr:hypothetical protein KP509_06G066800 [Ceratopteris richardii]